MRLEQAERQVRRVGGLVALALVAMALLGVARGWGRPKGRVVGRAYETLPVPFYVAISLIYIPALVWLWRPLPLRLPRPFHALAFAAGTLLYAAGLGLTFWGRLALGSMYNASTTQGAALYVGHRLVTSGPFALVRHPMYLGALIGSVGGVLLYRTWTMLFILPHVPVFWVRARREEQALAAEFGDAWTAYARRVPAGVPGLGAPHTEPADGASPGRGRWWRGGRHGPG